MDRKTFLRVANEALTEVLIEMGYAKEDHRKVCGWLGWTQYEPQHRVVTEWGIELGDGRQDARSILRIFIQRDSNELEAKQEIKQRIHKWGIVPPPHLGYEQKDFNGNQRASCYWVPSS